MIFVCLSNSSIKVMEVNTVVVVAVVVVVEIKATRVIVLDKLLLKEHTQLTKLCRQ